MSLDEFHARYQPYLATTSKRGDDVEIQNTYFTITEGPGENEYTVVQIPWNSQGQSEETHLISRLPTDLAERILEKIPSRENRCANTEGSYVFTAQEFVSAQARIRGRANQQLDNINDAAAIENASRMYQRW